MHALVPPHPGPLIAVSTLGANLGVTLGFGILIAIPTVIIAGPLFAPFAARWAPVPVPAMFVTHEDEGEDPAARPRPSFAAALASILLPVVLMMAKALADVVAPASTSVGKQLLDFLGTPVIALLLAVLLGIVLLARPAGMDRRALAKTFEASLPPIAGILLIVAAGGGFKQVLVDSGVGQIIAHAVNGNSASPLLLAWVVAVLIRLATGSATVATITASGILAPVAAGLSPTHTSLLVLAIGSGSLFLSHVNDAGFWLVKEYFGVSVGENLKTWSVMETLISVVGIVLVLVLGLVI
jgi:GntP family gluconate:H+ symporter